MFAVFALLSALCYGAADFLGGFTARRANTLAVVVVSQLAGLLLLLMMLPFFPHAAPGRADVLWGALAGVTGGGGVALLYRALAIGVMAAVAPTTAVCAVVIPVIVSVALGERPGATTFAGIALALVAIVLVSQSSDGASGTRREGDERRTKAFFLAVLSGVVIGFFFVALSRTSSQAGLWPLVVARTVSVGLFAVMAVLASQSLRIPAAILGIVAAAGALDMLANFLYLIASRAGPLSVVVTLASLYPASTVVLARLVLHERLSARQWVGVTCALVAVAVIVR
ncbi:MAG TPA: DMT family transporter [Vicinamibacterales bacterium]|nr:DMT family transporter [Vicinamibacterales bacterium]